MTTKKLGVLVAEELPIDPAVTLPADVQATIARGEAAYKRQSHNRNSGCRDLVPRVITSVADQNVQDRREANLEAQQRPPKGGRRQPPMTPRLRAVMIVVDRLKADGMRFAVGPNSRMNKAVSNWLNERASRSPDPRVSRRKQITPTAARELLKQVRAEGLPAARGTTRPKRTTQDIARELLRKLRENRTSGAD
jgi:hypothetical protein